jgi:hypothetical protein
MTQADKLRKIAEDIEEQWLANAINEASKSDAHEAADVLREIADHLE